MQEHHARTPFSAAYFHIMAQSYVNDTFLFTLCHMKQLAHKMDESVTMRLFHQELEVCSQVTNCAKNLPKEPTRSMFALPYALYTCSIYM